MEQYDGRGAAWIGMMADGKRTENQSENEQQWGRPRGSHLAWGRVRPSLKERQDLFEKAGDGGPVNATTEGTLV